MASLSLALAPLLVCLTLGREPLTLAGRALAFAQLGSALSLLRAVVPLPLLGDQRLARCALLTLLGLTAPARAMLGLPLLSLAPARAMLGLSLLSLALACAMLGLSPPSFVALSVERLLLRCAS